MTLRRSLLLPFAALVATTPVHAEFGGLMNGRSVARDALPDTSIEGGVVLGDLGEELDYQYFGARFNYRASPDVMFYGDIGQGELESGGDSADGIGFGIGAFYVIDGVFANTDFAIKGSYHTLEFENDNGAELDFSGLVIEAVFSGRNGLGASGNIGWYGNVGLHRLELGDEDDSEIGFGGGIVVPSQSGEFYLGIDIIDEMVFGGGFRYFVS